MVVPSKTEKTLKCTYSQHAADNNLEFVPVVSYRPVRQVWRQGYQAARRHCIRTHIEQLKLYRAPHIEDFIIGI